MCRAVLPLLSSGLDVLGAAGQAGTGQGEGGYTRAVGWRLELRYALWGWNRATKRGNLQEQAAGSAKHRGGQGGSRGREGPRWAESWDTARPAAPRWQRAAGAHPHKAGGMGTTTCGHGPWPRAQPQRCTHGTDRSGSHSAPSPGTAVPRGWGETRGAAWEREVGRGAGQDGMVGPVSGPLVAPLSPGRRGAPASPHTAHLQHTGGVCRALPQLLPGFVVVVVVVCVG